MRIGQELYKLEDGRIYYSINIKNANIYTTLSDGTALLTQNEVENEIQEPYYYISLGHTIWDSIFHSTKNSIKEQWGVIELQGELEQESTGGIVIRDIKKAYYQGRNENDKILIWEEGMKIPPAPLEIEKTVMDEDKWFSESYRINK